MRRPSCITIRIVLDGIKPALPSIMLPSRSRSAVSSPGRRTSSISPAFCTILSPFYLRSRNRCAASLSVHPALYSSRYRNGTLHLPRTRSCSCQRFYCCPCSCRCRRARIRDPRGPCFWDSHRKGKLCESSISRPSSERSCRERSSTSDSEPAASTTRTAITSSQFPRRFSPVESSARRFVKFIVLYIYAAFDRTLCFIDCGDHQQEDRQEAERPGARRVPRVRCRRPR